MDYYTILDLKKDCNTEDIKKSYKKLAFKWHPDRNNFDKEQCEKKFKEISEAYSVLSNPKSREKYDNKLDYSSTIKDNFNDPFDLFDSIFDRNNDKFFKNNSENFFGKGFNNSFFDNNFQNDFFTNNKSFMSSNKNSSSSFFSSKRESTKIVNGNSVKKTIIEDNNGKIEIYEINGKITKKIITKDGKSELYSYSDKDTYIKDN